MTSYIESFFEDPKGMLILLLLCLPGRLLAISAHESAHGWMAEKCGDNTARSMGRITLNPLRHLDPVGIIMMLVFGIGWARPVPVNPRNFRNYRKDDLKVSLAGIVANIFMFLSGLIVMYVILAFAISRIPTDQTAEMFIAPYGGENCLFSLENDTYYYVSLQDIFRYGINMSDYVIAPVFGSIVGYIYKMLYYFTLTNMCLAVFNLIPLPPLDGYHVLNDLILRKPLFATAKAQRIGSMILFVGVLSGVLSSVLSKIYTAIFAGIGSLAVALFHLIGLF